ncbi:hypothetical protein J2X46_000243 [Nocardioides sp. BE266]|uniref:hypothetical protein n=1 Tax=Nocardioides sp. BE266 TaxID=2817725 RepID=UPI0028568FA3|nr:hypothetical protein [Nocardioides sp. BE266]MDR7251271.1 hypothetical protein [Nocardioides sp. BE266]
MTTTHTLPGSRIEPLALRRVGQERRRLLADRSTDTTVYVPRHRADVPVDSAA